MKSGKYYRIEAAILETLKTGPKRTSEICQKVHDTLPVGILSPDWKTEGGSANRLTWKHEFHAFRFDFHVDDVIRQILKRLIFAGVFSEVLISDCQRIYHDEFS